MGEFFLFLFQLQTLVIGAMLRTMQLFSSIRNENFSLEPMGEIISLRQCH
jgi:hypothetical protein